MLSCVELTQDDVTLLCDEILDLHSKVISVTSTKKGINEEPPEARGLIESAVAASMCSHFGFISSVDFIEQIATLSAKIAKNHAFLDGNKRVAVLVTQHLLDVHYPGYSLHIGDMHLYRAILDIVTGDLEIKEYADMLRNSLEIPSR